MFLSSEGWIFCGEDGDKIGILPFTPFLSDFHNAHA